MVVKVYVSGISGNKEVKKRQQRVAMILESKHIEFVTIDITEPGKEQDKEFMQQNSNSKEAKHPLPPQMFNDEEYCGDYDEFDLANENDELENFLKVAPSVSKAEIILNKTEDKSGDAVAVNGLNGNTSSREHSAEKEPAAPEPVVEDTREEPAEEKEEAQSEEEEEEDEGASEQ